MICARPFAHFGHCPLRPLNDQAEGFRNQRGQHLVPRPHGSCLEEPDVFHPTPRLRDH